MRAPRDVTSGGVCETAFASSTYAPFTWRLLILAGWNWKCHVVIVIKTDLSGLCEQYVKSVGLVRTLFKSWGRYLTSYFARAPSCIGTTNPSRTGLNPLILLVALEPGKNNLSPICCSIWRRVFLKRQLIRLFGKVGRFLWSISCLYSCLFTLWNFSFLFLTNAFTLKYLFALNTLYCHIS